MNLWTVGRFYPTGEGPEGVSWSLCGVFDSERAATDACIDDLHFIQRFALNIPMGHGADAACIDTPESGHYPRRCRIGSYHDGPCDPAYQENAR